MTAVAPSREVAPGVPARSLEAELAGRTRFDAIARYTAMPLVLAAVSIWLYVYVTGHELDSIESRLLNQEFLTDKLLEHIKLGGFATLAVVAIAVPLGTVLTRPRFRRLTPFAIGLANIGQAIPSIGLIVFFPVVMNQIGFRPALYALVIHSALTVLRNTMVGLHQIDRALLEAGRGMGMTSLSVLFRIELPLAVPIILAGVRTALILNVATATIGTFINAGTLGDLITNGIALSRDPVLITGAVLTAVLAVGIDWLAGVAEDVLRPKGL